MTHQQKISVHTRSKSPTQKIIPLQSIHIKDDTPPKFNMEPENYGFQMDFPFPGTYFSGSMLNFGCVHIKDDTFWLEQTSNRQTKRHFDPLKGLGKK